MTIVGMPLTPQSALTKSMMNLCSPAKSEEVMSNKFENRTDLLLLVI